MVGGTVSCASCRSRFALASMTCTFDIFCIFYGPPDGSSLSRVNSILKRVGRRGESGGEFQIIPFCDETRVLSLHNFKKCVEKEQPFHFYQMNYLWLHGCHKGNSLCVLFI